MPETFDNLAAASEAITGEFLQTVVVVDDQAHLGADDRAYAVDHLESQPDPAAAAGGTRQGRRGLGVVHSPAARRHRDPDEHDLDAKALIDGFAAKGMVCAVLRPDAGETLLASTMLAVRRADIVLLDWDMHQDGGSRSLELVDHLLSAEGANRRLRMFAVYTAQADLSDIVDRLKELLKRHRLGNEDVQGGRGFTLTCGPVRIVVFAKEGARIPGTLRAARKRIVHVAELPSRLVAEFAAFAGGLVPNVALSALAAIRENTHRVLNNFRSDLDPAYLMHRTMLVTPSDAENHLVSLVASEISSVLHDAEPGQWANIEAIRLWLSQTPHVDYAERFSVPGKQPVRPPVQISELEDLLRYGVTNKDNPKCGQSESRFGLKHPHLAKIAGFASTYERANKSNASLAAQMLMKTRYLNPRPHLALGVLLSTGKGKKQRYWLCMQPRCDSIRLSQDRSFPLLPLELVKDGDKFDLVVPSSRGRYLRLKISYKPFHLSMVTFPATDSGKVEAELHATEGYRFRSTSRTIYRFRGELRPEKAQRIVQEFSSQFERIGLNESEWLRRWNR